MADGEISFEIINGEPYIKVGADAVPKKLGSGTVKINTITATCPSAKSTATLNGAIGGCTEIDVSNYSNITIGLETASGSGSNPSVIGIKKDGSSVKLSEGIKSNLNFDISEYISLRFICSVGTNTIATNQSYSVTFNDIVLR